MGMRLRGRSKRALYGNQSREMNEKSFVPSFGYAFTGGWLLDFLE